MIDQEQARPGRFSFEVTPEVIQKAYEAASKGLTYQAIAARLGITDDTLAKYRKIHSELSEAIKKGQSDAIGNIENALYEKALKGDTTAQIFYLKCRAHWKDRDNEGAKPDSVNDLKALTQMLKVSREPKND